MNYIHTKYKDWLHPKTLFWIIGSKPRLENMLEFCPEKQLPTGVNIYK